MAALRMGVGLVVLVGYLAVSGRLPSIGALTPAQWSWTLLTGVILAGYVATWFAALRRAPATVVTSVLVLGAVVTGALTAATKGTAPSPTRGRRLRPDHCGRGARRRLGAAGGAARLGCGRRGSGRRCGDAWPARPERRPMSRPRRAATGRAPSPGRSCSHAMPSARTAWATAVPTPSRSSSARPTVGGDDRALRELAKGFEGAWPYLELIARSNGIADPLDRRVVEAYWLGSALLDGIPAARSRGIPRREVPAAPAPRRLALARRQAGRGRRAVHAFHVLDVFPRVGLLRSGSMDRALEVMDSCRIRWGRVLERDAEALVVNVVPLEMVEGRLALGAARAERVQAWRGWRRLRRRAAARRPRLRPLVVGVRPAVAAAAGPPRRVDAPAAGGCEPHHLIPAEDQATGTGASRSSAAIIRAQASMTSHSRKSPVEGSTSIPASAAGTVPASTSPVRGGRRRPGRPGGPAAGSPPTGSRSGDGRRSRSLARPEGERERIHSIGGLR